MKVLSKPIISTTTLQMVSSTPKIFDYGLAQGHYEAPNFNQSNGQNEHEEVLKTAGG